MPNANSIFEQYENSILIEVKGNVRPRTGREGREGE
jgi:hypothetical protein